MQTLLLIIHLAYLTRCIFCVPHDPSNPPRDARPARNVESKISSPSPTPPSINATIYDSNGADITSSIQIRLYHQNPPPNSSLNDRQPPVFRLMNDCLHPNLAFVSSYCGHRSDRIGSMQDFTIHCSRNPDTVRDWQALQGVSNRLRGRCDQDENCFNSFSPTMLPPHGGGADQQRVVVPTAMCVKRVVFRNLIVNDEQGQPFTVGIRRFVGSRASMVMSGVDEVTPVRVGEFDVEPELEEGGGGAQLDGGHGKGGQSKKCTNCVDLETGQFVEGTDALKLQTTLLSAGAAAGILWLAVLSG